MVKKYEITIGEKFNRLTIISELESRYTSGGNSVRRVLVRCDCGNEKEIDLSSLRNNKTVSCGCYNLEKAGSHLRKHNHSNSRIYSIWKDMKRRCNNPNRKNYKNYGGRGISVCDEWFNDFSKFYNWSMENGYDETLTIERIDVNGNYEPSNCTWIARSEQNSNTRRQLEFEAIDPYGNKYKGKLIKEFAKIHNLESHSISDCLNNRQKSHKNWKFKRLS